MRASLGVLPVSMSGPSGVSDDASHRPCTAVSRASTSNSERVSLKVQTEMAIYAPSVWRLPDGRTAAGLTARRRSDDCCIAAISDARHQ
jgi:hypothetical protein